ncbi:MAG: phosphate ABC transporter substrate-binding protein PstS [Gemmatimonadota bacterium]
MTSEPRVGLRLAVVAIASTIVVSCSGGADSSRHPEVNLTGAGATFPYPLYRAWFSEYGAQANVRINYFSVGSAEGLRLLSQGDVDFGATDRPMRLTAGDAACGRVAIPTVIGPIAVAYNLPRLGTEQSLQVDARLLSNIYSGRVRRWNDEGIRKLNPGVLLPSMPIVVVHRANGSGTGRAFSSYLATSGSWGSAVGDTADAKWPVGLAAEGNEGVATEVKVTVGAIGYMELAYARLNRLSIAAVRTPDRGYQLPGRESPDYPITARTLLVIDATHVSNERGSALVSFIRWALRHGASQAQAMEYTTLPPDTIAHYDSVLTALQFGKGAVTGCAASGKAATSGRGS